MKTPKFGNDPINFSDLFELAAYFPEVTTPGHGSRTDAPVGYRYLSIPGGVRMKSALYAKPTPAARDMARQNCTDGSIGHFRIIPWKDKALVIATDSHYIADVWLAFIPLDQVPDANLFADATKKC
jgi:hypothetical protein